MAGEKLASNSRQQSGSITSAFNMRRSLLVAVLGCVLVHTTSVAGYVIGAPSKAIGAVEGDVQHAWYYENEARRSLLARKRQETRVLMELYYLAKVVRAFRLLGAFESPLFKSVLERITNEQLMDQLERKLHGVEGFEVISRIGTEGSVVDRMQIALANDYRLLAPLVLRTLRRLSALRTSAADDGVLIGELEQEIERNKAIAGGGEDDADDDAGEAEDRINFDDYEWTLEEDEPELEDAGRSETSQQLVPDAISELIATELDNFLHIVEQLSGISGIAREFDRADRKHMADGVRRRYNPSVGLDQRFFVGAVKELLAGKDLYEGRFELVEALDYVKSQLDGLEENERTDSDYSDLEPTTTT